MLRGPFTLLMSSPKAKWTGTYGGHRSSTSQAFVTVLRELTLLDRD